MQRLKIRTKRQLDAQHAADRAVLASRAQRAERAKAAASEPPTIRPPSPEEIERFAVGGCGTGCQPSPNTATCQPQVPICRPTSINDCYHEVASKHGCPLKVTSGGVQRVDGQNRIEFRVEPTQSNYFLPIAVRLSGRGSTDPDQIRVWLLTAVMVKNHPQENYHQPNPDASTVVGVESVAYDGKTAGDVPAFEVAWGPFSRAAQADNLVLVGWNPYAAGMFLNARAELWGYEIEALPQGWKCGHHPGRLPQPAIDPSPAAVP
ncbi:hypothetical protein [Paraliomyxa miuraensis]|uniref:hypothetical protein n=1 Tax=Paraliomyxa miuraensis TaxID=376150 RepID=UPI00225BCAA5|nr:hypothetical protein [Paraliomyxa miuraensis]MCX4239176.1 hypothetical protein [Paraliomyxa miuraensis]